MKDRIGYYDLARGLGIIFVVIGHIDTFYVPFRSVVITFHMALFFMISGMLFWETKEEESEILRTIKKKFCRIMIPYILFSLLSMVIEFIRLALQGIFYWPHFRALLISAVSLYGNSVMWFLPALFISEIVFLLVRKSRNDLATIMIVAGLVAFAVWANTWNLAGGEFLQSFMAAMIRGIYCTIFICIGYYIRKYIIPLKIPAYLYGVTGGLLIWVSVRMNSINPKVDLRAMHWGDILFGTDSNVILVAYPVCLYLIGAASGALGVIFMCKMLDRFSGRLLFRGIVFFGSNTLIIMATHLDFHVLHYSMDLAAFLNSLMPSSILYHGMILIFVFAAEAVLIRLINKYAPILTGKHKKITF